MKRNIIMGLAAASLLTLGLSSIPNVDTIQAATVKVGKRSRLTHNAYIYNNKAQVISSGTSAAGTNFKILGISKIKGAKYAKVGKNEFIKLSNFTGKSSVKSRTYTSTLTHNSYLYNSKGKRIQGAVLPKGSSVRILKAAQVKINGHWYYQIAKNTYVRANNVSRHFNEGNTSASNTTNTHPSSTTTPAANATPNSSSTASNNGTAPSTTPSSNQSSRSTTNNGNSNTDKQTDSDDDNNETDIDKDMTVKHDTYVYDKNGKRILGSFLSKGDVVRVYYSLPINGSTYYNFGYSYPTNDGESSITGYILKDVFTDNGKDTIFTPATQQEFSDFTSFIQEINKKANNNTGLLTFSSPQAQIAFRNANIEAYNVANDDRSSITDINTAKNDLINAFNKLNGKKVQIKVAQSSQPHKFTTDEIKEILTLIKEKKGYKNIKFSRIDDTGYYLYYTADHKKNLSVYIPYYVQFVQG